MDSAVVELPHVMNLQYCLNLKSLMEYMRDTCLSNYVILLLYIVLIKHCSFLRCI